MTKDEAITAVKEVTGMSLPWDDRHYEALQMAIEALSVQDVPDKNVGDTISRQAAIDALHMHLMYRMGTDSNKKRLDEWINNLPSAQQECIHCKDCTHWLDIDDGRQKHRMCADINGDWFCADAERRTDEQDG